MSGTDLQPGIWNRATMFVKRREILDFWHALEHAWGFARLRYGVGSAQADAWVHRLHSAAPFSKVVVASSRIIA